MKLGFHRSGKCAAAGLAVVVWLAAGCGGSVAEPATQVMADGGPQPAPDASVADVFDDATTSDASVRDAIIQDDVAAADSSPTIGPCRGPAPAPIQCLYLDAACGPFGTCHYESQHYFCCGAAFACCSSPADCCSQECIGGTCTSAGQPCSTDADCNDGMSCLQGVCMKWPGSACNVGVECTSYVCDDGGCTCGYPQSGPLCRTDADCCIGTCVQGSCALSHEGGPCKKDSDCIDAACVGGQCQCIPAGSPSDGIGPYCGPAGWCWPTDHCCSGSYVTGASRPVCTAGGGGWSGCTTRVPDCYGGACVNGTPSNLGSGATSNCACVGPTGYCNTDSDCCAGATACVQGRCSADQ